MTPIIPQTMCQGKDTKPWFKPKLFSSINQIHFEVFSFFFIILKKLQEVQASFEFWIQFGLLYKIVDYDALWIMVHCWLWSIVDYDA